MKRLSECYEISLTPSGRVESGCQKRTAAKYKGLLTYVGRL